MKEGKYGVAVKSSTYDYTTHRNMKPLGHGWFIADSWIRHPKAYRTARETFNACTKRYSNDGRQRYMIWRVA